MGQSRRVDDIFYIGEGFGVGVGDTRTTVLPAEFDQRLGLQLVASGFACEMSWF